VQDLEPVLEGVGDLADGHRRRPRRRELERQRQPVEPPAQCDDGPEVSRGDPERRIELARVVQEQAARRVRVEQLWRAVIGGSLEGLDGPHLLAVDAEPLPAGRQYAQTGGAGEQRCNERGASVDEVLAVVQHEQHVAVPEVADESTDGGLGGAPQVERAADHVGHCGGARHVLERDPRGTGGECGFDLPRDLEGEPRLPDPAWSGERDATRSAAARRTNEHGGQCGDVLVPTDDRTGRDAKTGLAADLQCAQGGGVQGRGLPVVEREGLGEHPDGERARGSAPAPLQRRDRVDAEAGHLGQRLLRQPGVAPLRAEQPPERCLPRGLTRPVSGCDRGQVGR